MADYNFELAKKIIEVAPNLESATMGMHEDWFWTAQEIWNSINGFSESFHSGVLGGISGSHWATPVIELHFIDGSTKTFNCYTGDTSDILTRIEKSLFVANGCLSAPCQEHRINIDVENFKTE